MDLTTKDVTWSVQDDALAELTFYLIVAGLTEAKARKAWLIVARSYNALHEFIPGGEA